MGPQKVVNIYPDVAFAVSFLMNALILWGTSKLNKIELRWSRIVCGAGLGAAYSFAAAFPSLALLQTFWLKVPFSVLMVAVAFSPVNLRRFAELTAIFYIVSFSLGGIFLGILYFLSSNPYNVYFTGLSTIAARYFVPALVFTITFYLLMTKFAGRLLQKRLARSLFLVPVRVIFDHSEVEIQALIDTGNKLQDPLSRTPVVVVEYAAVKELLPPEIQHAFEQGQDHDMMLILDSISKSSWSTRFRVIPFTSLGRENGLLVGFKPDRIDIINDGNEVSTRDVIIGIYRRTLSPEGGYRALLNPEILDLMTA